MVLTHTPPTPHHTPPPQKRASKSTYGRRRPGEDEANETDASLSLSKSGSAHPATAADEETEDEDAPWLAGDEAGHSYRSTTQTSSGRISRPPRKNSPGSPMHTPASRAAARGKGPAAAAAAAAAATASTAASSTMSRTPSGGSITAGVWGGVPGGLGGLTVKIPAPRDAIGEHDLFAAADGVTVAALGSEAPSQTPTSVAELYPVGAMGVGDDPFGKYGHAQYHRQQLHPLPAHHHAAGAYAHAGSCASTSATSSAASSLSPGREHQMLGEDPTPGVGVGVGAGLCGEEGMEYGMDDDLSKLQALAGRVAPEWAEALNEALGALEGVAANGQPHEGAGLYALPPVQHHSLGPVGGYHAAAAAGGRAGVGRHGSIGSLTDSQAGSSATGSYLPSSSDSDGGHSSGSEAAAPAASSAVSCPPGHGVGGGRFLVGEEEDDEELDLLHPAAKRARLTAAAAAPAPVGKAGAAALASAVVEEEDYGYFTTEEELDQMLNHMLGGPAEGVGVGVDVGPVGDARWGLDD